MTDFPPPVAVRVGDLVWHDEVGETTVYAVVALTDGPYGHNSGCQVRYSHGMKTRMESYKTWQAYTGFLHHAWTKALMLPEGL